MNEQMQNNLVVGVLEYTSRGNGALRDLRRDFKPRATDPLVPAELIDRLGVRQGLKLGGPVQPGDRGTPPVLRDVTTIEDEPIEHYQRDRLFEELTVIDPHEPIRLETGPMPLGPRVMDLFTPIGKGQRGLIVAPPRSGKTILAQQIAAAVAANHPEIHLIVLLVDERPEEVTEMKRSVKGDVLASSNDQSAEEHLRLATLTFERAKRITESGRHALILLDSLTRLARAANKFSNTGRTMSGGVDIRAMELPKKLFGSARVFEEGGSLTVLGTVLVETNSRMDELIFQEFKGTGNMELVLDRKLADRRVWPAIDLNQSGTRKEERLLSAVTLERVTKVRRALAGLSAVDAMESLTKQLAQTSDNAAFLEKIAGITG